MSFLAALPGAFAGPLRSRVRLAMDVLRWLPWPLPGRRGGGLALVFAFSSSFSGRGGPRS